VDDSRGSTSFSGAPDREQWGGGRHHSDTTGSLASRSVRDGAKTVVLASEQGDKR
jgi:hypothetical protein